MSEDGEAAPAPEEKKKKKKNIWTRSDAPDDPVPETNRKSKKEKDTTEAEGLLKKKKKSQAEAGKEKADGTNVDNLDTHGVDFNKTRAKFETEKPSWVRTIFAAFANWILMVAFAIAQGAIIFIDEPNWKNIAMSMNMNLISAGVLGMVVSLTSEAPIFIAGPDLTSCVLLGDSMRKISNYAALHLDLGILPVPEIATPTPAPSTSTSANTSTNSSRRLVPKDALQSEDGAWHVPTSEEYLDDWWIGVQQTKFSAFSFISWSFQDMFGLRAANDEQDENEDSDYANSPRKFLHSGNKAAIFRRLSGRRRESSTTSTTTRAQTNYDPSSFCTDSHLEQYETKCWHYDLGVKCTYLVLCAMSSLLIGVTLLLIGAFKLCRYIEFVPRGITDAFNAVVGMKIFTSAVKICLLEPKSFVPAMVAGVPMYFVLTRRLGIPAITMPIFLLAPIGMWIYYLDHQGISMETAREDGLYLPTVPNEMPWHTYEWLQYSDFIHYQAWRDIYPEMVSLVVLVVINSLAVGLRMAEDFMPIFINRDYETKIAGIANCLIFPFAGIPGFAQLRLSLCNYGTQLNVKDRRAGILTAVLCLGTAFVPKDKLLMHVPRNVFAIVLFCGGAGYIAEHLWGSRKYLSTFEWSQVVAIIAIYVTWDSIFYALVVGNLLIGVQFISKYSKVPCIDGVPLHGGELVSRERHTPLMMRSICHIANSWVLIIKLQGYVLFASVYSVTRHIRDILRKQEKEQVPEHRKLKFVIFDGQELNGLECSASKDLERLRATAADHGVAILWSSLDPKLVDEMLVRNVVDSQNSIFYDIYEAMLEIEQHIRIFRNRIQERWLSLHPMFKQLADRSRLRENFEPFRRVFPFDAARFGCPWIYCSKKKIKAFETVLWEDDMSDKELFLIHTGAVGIFKKLPKDTEDWKPPEVIYKHGWFVNRQFLFREPTELIGIAMEDGEVLSWNSHQWWKMVREKPIMAASIMEVAMRQMAFDGQVVSSLFAASQKLDVDDEGEIDLSHMDVNESELLCPTDIPYDLAQQIQGLEAAQFLKEFKLYEPIEADAVATALPEMPKKIREDLVTAFWTYAIDDGEGKYKLPPDYVKDALMYAGIFSMLSADIADQSLDEKEFIAIGHETALTRLSKKQVAKIYNIFKSYDKDKSGQLARDEMFLVFRDTFHPTISEDEVNGICGAWDDDGSGQINAKEFVGILARFIRIHEPDWNLLLGFRELFKKTKKEKINHKDRLTLDLIMASKHCTISEEEAEEMLWACDCFDLEGDGKELDLPGFVAAVITDCEYAHGFLPPKPKRPPKKGQKDPQEVDDSKGLQKNNVLSRRTNKNNNDADAPEEDTNENDDVDGANRNDADDDDPKQAPRRLPSTAMLKNGTVPFRAVGEKPKIPDTSFAKLHTIFEYPQSGRCAQLYSVLMAVFIVASIVKPAVEVLAEANATHKLCPKDFPYAYHSGFAWCCQTNYEKEGITDEGRACDGSIFHYESILSKCCRGDRQVRCESPPCLNWSVPDTSKADDVALVGAIIFTVDYLLRLLVCKSHLDQTRMKWMLNPLNICDLGSIVPFWYGLATGTGDSPMYRMIRALRFFRLTKNAKLQKVGSRAGILVSIMVVWFVVMGCYYQAYSKQNEPDDTP